MVYRFFHDINFVFFCFVFFSFSFIIIICINKIITYEGIQNYLAFIVRHSYTGMKSSELDWSGNVVSILKRRRETILFDFWNRVFSALLKEV